MAQNNRGVAPASAHLCTGLVLQPTVNPDHISLQLTDSAAAMTFFTGLIHLPTRRAARMCRRFSRTAIDLLSIHAKYVCTRESGVSLGDSR